MNWAWGILKAFGMELAKRAEPELVLLGVNLVTLGEIGADVAIDTTLTFADKKNLWLKETEGVAFIAHEASKIVSDIPSETFSVIVSLLEAKAEDLFSGAGNPDEHFHG